VLVEVENIDQVKKLDYDYVWVTSWISLREEVCLLYQSVKCSLFRPAFVLSVESSAALTVAFVFAFLRKSLVSNVQALLPSDFSILIPQWCSFFCVS